MRAQLKTLINRSLSADRISFSNFIRYRTEAESVSGFPGGRTYTHFTNSTLVRSLVMFTESTRTDRY